MSTVHFLADVECPWCWCRMERTVEALVDSGTVPVKRFECEGCGKVFTIEATVDVAIRKAEKV